MSDEPSHRNDQVPIVGYNHGLDQCRGGRVRNVGRPAKARLRNANQVTEGARWLNSVRFRRRSGLCLWLSLTPPARDIKWEIVNPDEQTPKPTPPISSEKSWLRAFTAIVGFGLVFLLIGLLVLLYTQTGGGFLPAHWVGFYVAVALITGLAFWLITGSPAEFSWKEFGARLGGGAAIGIIFMFAAQKITPAPPPNIRIIDVAVPGGTRVSTADHDAAIASVIALENGTRFLVQFTEGAMSGKISFHYLKGQERHRFTYNVPRVGALPEPKDERETE